ncbi:ABC transporter ATP-binding protein [Agrobacterium tumefaciens]|uniref:ABC transporter ATP-binding protein n=1 Tax=Agrobacterium tumefaciens TaxID=358 RepID=UPI001574292B|nr:ABC transporter ATP-binding protein [Agrobacterium tumefaciens]NTE65133.1 ABC transporter ATP-binding protein [Agrobacterium tumefaciens]
MGEVKFSHISKGFGSTQVLDDVSLSIAEGEFVTLLGPSGCGKSTLLRILAGLEVADAGNVLIGGRQVNGMRPKARDVAMVFQSYALYPHMTVANNLMLPLRMRRLGFWQRFPVIGRLLPGTRAITREIEAEVARTAEAIGIGHLLDRKPGQLSGGQRQRVAVGRAMVRRPTVFLMDEPLSNLDAKLRVQMRAEIKDLHRKLGVTFIYVTHDQAEAMTMSDRVAVLLDGRLQQVAAPHDIYADPNNRRVAEFIGSPKINILETSIEADGSVRIGNCRLATLGSQTNPRAISVGIRPEALRSTNDPQTAVLSGLVTHIEDMGSDVFVHIRVNDQTDQIIYRAPAEEVFKLRLGQQLDLTTSAENIVMFEMDGSRIRSDQVAGARRVYA